MPLFPVVKMGDAILGVDAHTTQVPPAPPIPMMPHPYFGPLYLWNTPKFPKMDVLVNGMPICTVGSMGYYPHIPTGLPVGPSLTNTPYWKRYIMNVDMGLTLMMLTIFANTAIALIAAALPQSIKPKWAEDFIKDVTGIDTTDTLSTLTSIQTSFAAFSKWSTWVKLLMPPLPYFGAQGSCAVGSPNVTANGGAVAFAGPLLATSCSEIPVVPNANTLGFSNVMVGVSLAQLARGIAVSTAQAGVSAGVGYGVSRLQGQRGSG